MDTFIDYLGSSANAPSEFIRCDPQHLTGLLGTIDKPTRGETSGFSYIVEHLKARGMIEQPAMGASDGTIGYRLTFDGWERFDELRRGIIDSHTAFMAMG